MRNGGVVMTTARALLWQLAKPWRRHFVPIDGRLFVREAPGQLLDLTGYHEEGVLRRFQESRELDAKGRRIIVPLVDSGDRGVGACESLFDLVVVGQRRLLRKVSRL
jgi:hypothetical protein